MKFNKQLFLGCIAASSLLSSAAQADLDMFVNQKVIHDDNVNLFSSMPVHSWAYVLNPGVKLETEGGLAKVGFELSGESGTYSNSYRGSDDYSDFVLKGNAALDLSVSNRLSFDVKHQVGHDQRGTGRQDVRFKETILPETPDQWYMDATQVKYDLGAPGAPLRASASWSYAYKQYTNNEADIVSATNTPVLPGAKNLSNDTEQRRLTGYVKVMPRTSLLVEVRDTLTDYRSAELYYPTVYAAQSNRDSEMVQYFAGAEWDATAKTSGAIRVGYMWRDPNSEWTPTVAGPPARVSGTSGKTWEANIVWKPKTYTSFRIDTQRAYTDIPALSGTIDREDDTVTWRFDWSRRLTSDVYLRRTADNYQGGRGDTLDGFGIAATLNMMQGVKFKTSYDYRQRNTSILGLNYNDNQLTLELDLDFK